MKRIFLCLVLVGAVFAFGALLNRIAHPNHQQSIVHTAYPNVVVVGDPGLVPLAGEMWRVEAERRFPTAVVLLCHGQDINGDFYCFPAGDLQTGLPVTQEMDALRLEYPDRPIVILSCNPLHIKLTGHPNCFYSTSETWVIPDRNVLDSAVESLIPLKLRTDDGSVTFPSDAPVNRWALAPDVVGDIFEFQEAI